MPHQNTKMHASRFSYNITRPYPFRWFTPLVICGGIILAVLFSLVNFAANGYYMKTVYTNDPNTTLRNGEKYVIRCLTAESSFTSSDGL